MATETAELEATETVPKQLSPKYVECGIARWQCHRDCVVDLAKIWDRVFISVNDVLESVRPYGRSGELKFVHHTRTVAIIGHTSLSDPCLLILDNPRTDGQPISGLENISIIVLHKADSPTDHFPYFVHSKTDGMSSIGHLLVRGGIPPNWDVLVDLFQEAQKEGGPWTYDEEELPDLVHPDDVEIIDRQLDKYAEKAKHIKETKWAAYHRIMNDVEFPAGWKEASWME